MNTPRIKQAKRLVVFGCSLTYGHGLPDCIGLDRNDPGPNPSKMGWPNLLAYKIGLTNQQVANVSRCGAGNNWIWHSAANFEYQKGDLVIVNWSYIDSRWDILVSRTKFHSVGAGFTSELSKNYVKHFGDSMPWDLSQHFFVRANHLNYMLKEKGIDCFNLTVDPVGLEYHLPHAAWNQVNFLKPSINTLRPKYPKAADGSHPGLDCHVEFANQVYEALL